MGWFNQVQTLRKRIGLSQRDLALRARTSQQQVQRIESGLQAPRIGLALRLAHALGHPLEQVFPFPAPPPPRPPAFADCADEVGLGWALSFRLQGGAAGRLPVAASEIERLRRAIGATATPNRFIVFASRHHEVALRLDRLSLAQLHSSLQPDEPAERGFPASQAILFLAGDPMPMIFSPEPDDAALEATEPEEDCGACRNQALLAALDLDTFEAGERFALVDARNGETIHVLAQDLACLAMPFDALSPDCLPPPAAIRTPALVRPADNDA